MNAVECTVRAAPARVFAALADGWTYPLWVVGATHMRNVDAEWPEVGACLHHSLGVWPLTLEDRTEVLEMRPDRRLVLRAHAWPSGSARIELSLSPVPEGTLVRMWERLVSGPGALVPGAVQDVLLRRRNIECLRRLQAIAENRCPSRSGGEPP